MSTIRRTRSALATVAALLLGVALLAELGVDETPVAVEATSSDRATDAIDRTDPIDPPSPSSQESPA